jgi:hypothetical protein
MPLAMERWEALTREPRSIASMLVQALDACAVGLTLSAQNGAYLQSAYYREFERELDSCWLLDAIIRGCRRTGH